MAAELLRGNADSYTVVFDIGDGDGTSPNHDIISDGGGSEDAGVNSEFDGVANDEVAAPDWFAGTDAVAAVEQATGSDNGFTMDDDTEGGMAHPQTAADVSFEADFMGATEEGQQGEHRNEQNSQQNPWAAKQQVTAAVDAIGNNDSGTRAEQEDQPTDGFAILKDGQFMTEERKLSKSGTQSEFRFVIHTAIIEGKASNSTQIRPAGCPVHLGVLWKLEAFP